MRLGYDPWLVIEQTLIASFSQVEMRTKKDFGLKGRAALITGASRGIGKACALALAEEGCNLPVCSRGKEALDAAAEEIRQKGVEVLAVRADVTRPEDVEGFVSKAIETFGEIDILINNAGTGRLSDPMELPEGEFRYNMDLISYFSDLSNVARRSSLT